MPTTLRIDCHNKEYETGENDSMGTLSYALKEHFTYKSYKHAWSDDRNVVCLGRSVLAGTNVQWADDGVFVLKNSSTKQLTTHHLPELGRAMLNANVNYATFEKKSEKPLIIGVKWDGEWNVKFVEVGEKSFKSIAKKGTRNMRRKAELLLRGFHAKQPSQLFSVGLGSLTGYGCVTSDETTTSGGVGSVLKQAHNVIAVSFSGSAINETFDELTLSQVYYNNEKLLEHNFAEQIMRKNEELLFNKSLIKVPEKILGHAGRVGSFGLMTGLLTSQSNNSVEDAVRRIGLDSETTGRMMSGLLHSYIKNAIPREEFGVVVDATFNVEEFLNNPYYYSNEHAEFFKRVLGMIENRNLFGMVFSLPYSEMLREIRKLFGKKSTAHFLPEKKTSFKNLLDSEAGLSTNNNLPMKVFSELAGISLLKKVDYFEQTLKNRELVEKFNSLSR